MINIFNTHYVSTVKALQSSLSLFSVSVFLIPRDSIKIVDGRWLVRDNFFLWCRQGEGLSRDLNKN